MKYVYIVSLGCPKNFVDTEVMAASLIENNIGITADLEYADIFLINTCAFIASARDEAAEVIEEAIDWKQDDPGTRSIVVTGCLNSWDKEGAYRETYSEVDLWTQFKDIETLGALLASQTTIKPASSDKPFYLYNENSPRLQLTPQHYAYVKISEGCNNCCSYCTIPSIRGPLQSRTVESVETEVKNLLANGVNEIILIAQDTSNFGADLNDDNQNLAALLSRLDALPGKHWIRVMYMHPAHLQDQVIDILATAKHIIPYLDIPLQHISDPILKSMNRRITKAETISLLDKLRSKIPNLALRTTFIIGYPGETDQNFEELFDFVKEQEFDRMGTFCYFQEENTRAALLDDQVPEETADDRRDKLMLLQNKISLKKNQSLIGQTLNVIIDSIEKKQAIGRTYMDAPDIDNTVEISLPAKSRLKTGKIIKIKIESAFEYSLKGTIVK